MFDAWLYTALSLLHASWVLDCGWLGFCLVFYSVDNFVLHIRDEDALFCKKIRGRPEGTSSDINRMVHTMTILVFVDHRLEIILYILHRILLSPHLSCATIQTVWLQHSIITVYLFFAAKNKKSFANPDQTSNVRAQNLGYQGLHNSCGT